MGNCYKITSRQGNQINEDAVWCSEGSGGVIDGSSGLYPGQVTTGKSDAAWFSGFMAVWLQQQLISDDSLAEIVEKGCHKAMDEYLGFLGEGSYEEPRLPSASAAFFRIRKERLEGYLLGDCTILLRLKNGVFFVKMDKSVSAMDDQIVAAMLRIAGEQQISVSQTLDCVKEQLLRNRKLKNTAQGYWIMDPSGIGAVHGETFSYPVSEVDSLAIMSDGFYAACTLVHMYSEPEELLKAMEQEPLEEVAAEIHQILDQDPEWNRYPRFKQKDDASALWYKFKS